MSFEDRPITCIDCQQLFTFSAGEQEFFEQKGLKNLPKRCPQCRLKLKMQQDGKDPTTGSSVPCVECGAMAYVPFKPSGHKPVYCKVCFLKQKGAETKDGA